MERATAVVGRAAELSSLDAALDGVASGRAETVLVSGEPGIGKSVLLAELGRRARQRGFLVLDGRATEFERDDPFAVFVAALDPALDSATDAAIAALSEKARAGLAGVLPTLAVPGSGVPDRLRTHAAVRAVLRGLARQRPVLLVLDDLHWADAASTDLFAYLLRHPPTGQVLLAGALRPAQAPARLRAACEIDPGDAVLELPLGPLAPDAAAELLAGCDAPTVDELYQDSGGNPFYLAALARAPRAAGTAAGRPLDVPAPVLAALTGELRALPPLTQQAAWGAAVAGDPFEHALAAAAAGFDTDVFLAALDALVAADVVRVTALPGRFRFRHPVVRRAVHEAAAPGWRVAAHARAAAVLAARGAPAAARAHHVEHSAAPGDDAAVAVLAEAGHAAAGRAPEAAAHWFTAALRLLPDGAEHRERRIELLPPLALAAGSSGRFDAARAAVDELLALLPAEAAPTRVELVAFRAFIDNVTHRPDQARELARRELATLGDDRPAERAALQIELAHNALVRCDYADLAACARAALHGARQVRNPSLEASAAALVGLGEYNTARIDSARTALDLSAGLIDDLPDDVLATRLDAVLIQALAEGNMDRCAAAVAHAGRGLDLAAASGQVLLTPLLYVTRAVGLAFSGRIRDAVEDTAAAYEVAVLTGSDLVATLARGLSSWLHVCTGDLDTALRFSAQAIRSGSAMGSALTTSNVGVYHAEALLESGRPEQSVETLLDTAGGPDLPLLERPFRSRARQVLVRAAVERADLAAAADWLARGQAELADIPLSSRHADLLHARSVLHLARDEPGPAATAALAAVTAADDGGRPVETGRARTLAGTALLRAGDRAAGLAQLRRAEQDLDALGARRYRDLAVRELRRAGHRVHRIPATPGPGLLSAREREIADLAAAGRTNRQIAAQLVISERTVETHVARILGKLHIRTRAAIGSALHSAT